MAWDQLELTASHKTYLILSSFLILYTLFATLIRNRLHLAEPPIALLLGILVGPYGLNWLNPNVCNYASCEGPSGPPHASSNWGWTDSTIQETTRIIVGIQVFVVGVTLPRYFAHRHWRSVAMLLGPVMVFGWLICALFAALVFGVSIPTALVVAACLTPTDPVLASSILSNSQFSERVPKRLRDVLAAESGCNDGVSFPFLFAGLYALRSSTFSDAIKEYVLVTLLWQCVLGTLVGLLIGTAFNRALRFSEKRAWTDDAGLTAFYLLLALLSVGTGSILGSDDFLVAFGAGYGFARDGAFAEKIHDAHLPDIIDLLLNSAMFVYLGTIVPWGFFADWEGKDPGLAIAPWRMAVFIVLVLLFRRLPAVMAVYRFMPSIRTWREALFAGWFGPMGLGGLFLAMESRAVLETGKSIPLPVPPGVTPPLSKQERAVELVWPVVCMVVVASTLVHGFSVLVVSVGGHFNRPEGERAPLIGGETEPLGGMVHGDSEEE